MRPCWWRDAPAEHGPQVRRGHIVRWRCPACDHTRSCSPTWALPGKRMTRALDAWMRQARQAGASVNAIAKRCGLDEKTVRTWASG